jgi:hypothetical protein
MCHYQELLRPTHLWNMAPEGLLGVSAEETCLTSKLYDGQARHPSPGLSMVHGFLLEFPSVAILQLNDAVTRLVGL